MRVPLFPPLLSGQVVEAGEDPAAVAMTLAAAGRAGAGDFYWLRDDATARCAVVLEPETSAADALCMIPLAMVAATDAIGSVGEANLAITHRWPAVILANGAEVGAIGMRFPEGVNGAMVPDYAVLSMEVAVRWPRTPRAEPGEERERTVLHEEGCGEVDTAGVLESWSRHFLAWVDTWESHGFGPVKENWLFRADARNRDIAIEAGGRTVRGVLAGIDDKGGALVSQDSGTRLVSLEEIWFGKGALSA